MSKIINKRDEVVPIDSVRPHELNPNRGDIPTIQESIRANGFYGRLIVQESSGKILAGEHRWRAAKEEGFDEVPVTYVDVNDEQALRILLVDNRTAEKANRQPEELAELLDHLWSTDEKLTGTGYTGDDLDSLLDDLNQLPGHDSFEDDNGEIDPDDLLDNPTECPRCGFEFEVD